MLFRGMGYGGMGVWRYSGTVWGIEVWGMEV